MKHDMKHDTYHDLTWHHPWKKHIQTHNKPRGFPQAIAPLERNIKPEEFISFNGGGPSVGWLVLLVVVTKPSTFSNLFGYEGEK